MTSSSFALQAAIRAALESDAGLIGLMGASPSIYDRVPPDAVLPYVHFGDWTVDENDTDDARIDRHTVTIEAWSAYAGLKEARAIAAVIELALHGAALTLDGYALIDLSFVGSAFARDEKERISQALLRFRALTQAT
jgi:Protein of unknown function (DUF3168)